MTMPICKSSRTLFSVVWYGRNRRESASETIKALHAQRCGDFELVIEDCGSTDGTLDLFEAAAAQDPRIRIFRRSATRSGEVLLSAMRRCKGDYVVVCPNEGHFLPNAFETIAREFSKQPTAGAICAAGFLVNGHGRTLDRADIVSLLLTSYRPFLPAAFSGERLCLQQAYNEMIGSWIHWPLICAVGLLLAGVWYSARKNSSTAVAHLIARTALSTMSWIP